jgi:hypothetical protein
MPTQLDPLTGIVDRFEAEFDEPVLMESHIDLGDKKLTSRGMSSSQPILPSMPGLSGAPSPLTLFPGGKTATIVKPKMMERRKSVRNLLVMATKNKGSLKAVQLSISEDDDGD